MTLFHLSGGRRLSWRTWVLVAVVAASQLGCAAQSAFREGKRLVEQGDFKGGLNRFETASRLEPGSAEYRVAYLQLRERHGQALIEQAAKAVERRAYADAERLYREALAAATHQDKALAGLRWLEDSRRWDLGLQEAAASVERKSWELADQQVKTLLAARPRHPEALQLLQRVQEAAPKRQTDSGLAAAYRKPITIEFKDTPLRTVFEVISRTSRLNFIFDKDVKTDARATIFLRNSTVEAAVNWLLLTNQLEQRVLDSNSVLIYPATQAKQREYQPLVVKSFYLANADAKNVAATLKSILKSRDVVVDEKLNMVILKDNADAMRLAEKLVALHDVSEPEVMLEVEILEVKRGRLLNLGVRWPDQVNLSVLPKLTDGPVTLEDLRDPPRSMVGVGLGAASINAQKQDVDANILANPRIRVRNREKAKIHIGERVPNITTTSTVSGFLAESINYVDVGLKLDVEPTIFPDNEVAIRIGLEVSSITSQQQTKTGSLAYQLGTRTAQTVLRLKDGENQVLAGLINDEDRRTANKVPGLGELPLVGRLFGSQADDAIKSEIVLSITPRILRNVGSPDAASQEFEAGTEASVRRFPSGGSGGEAVSGSSSPSLSAAAGGDAGRASLSMPGQMPMENLPATDPASASQGPPPGQAAMAAGAGPAGMARPAEPVAQTSSPDAGIVPAQGGAAPSRARLILNGPGQARVGEDFVVTLALESEQAVVSVPVAIGFDPTALQVVGVTEGSFLKQRGGQSAFQYHADAGGQVVLTATRTGANGATGSGSLAMLQFKVLPGASGSTTSVKVLTSVLMGAGGSAVEPPLPPPYVVTLGR